MTAPICDISYCQSQGIDWAKLAKLRVGVIARAGQAVYEDELFRSHYAGAMGAGVPFGMYWFYQPNLAAGGQVSAFLQIYNSLPTRPRVIALDCENITYTGVDIWPPSVEQHTSWIGSWLAQVQAATGFTPGIYTRKNYWDAWIKRSSIWATYWLWVASWTQYSGASPLIPADWSAWKVWQYQGGTGRQDGITGPVDLNYYNGTTEEMYSWFGVKQVEIPPPESDISRRVEKLEKWAKSFGAG